jgi:hypothetical protein
MSEGEDREDRRRPLVDRNDPRGAAIANLEVERDRLNRALDNMRPLAQEILTEVRISGRELDGENLAAWMERRWPDFFGSVSDKDRT